jgi:hypothetical protein
MTDSDENGFFDPGRRHEYRTNTHSINSGIPPVNTSTYDPAGNVANMPSENGKPTTESVQSVYSHDIRSFFIDRSQKPVWRLSDYTWLPSVDTTVNTQMFDNEIRAPKIIVREIQPVESFDLRALTPSNSAPNPKDGAGGASGGGGPFDGTIAKMFGRTLAEGAKLGMDLAIRGKAFTNGGLISATDYTNRVIPHSILNTYELPYFSDKLFHSPPSGWDTEGASKKSKSQNFTFSTLSTNLPTAPIWSGGSVDSTNGVSTVFNLLNHANIHDATDNLVRNYRFLTSLVAGAFWMQIYFFQKSSNLYSVECPGRFYIPYASMNVEVTIDGKLRYNQQALDKLRSYGFFEGFNFKDIKFPDTYKIKVDFTPVCANNYNTFLQSQNRTYIKHLRKVSTEAIDQEEDLYGAYIPRKITPALYTDVAADVDVGELGAMTNSAWSGVMREVGDAWELVKSTGVDFATFLTERYSGNLPPSVYDALIYTFGKRQGGTEQ